MFYPLQRILPQEKDRESTHNLSEERNNSIQRERLFPEISPSKGFVI